MTDQSPGLHGISGGSSSSRSNFYGRQNPDDLNSDDLTDLNLDTTLLNEDPLAEDSDAQSVISSTLNRYKANTIEGFFQEEEEASVWLNST